MRKLFPLALLVFATGAAAAPADIVHTRISNLRELGAAAKAINDGLRTDEAQTILIQQSARQVRNAANQMPGWFPAGSGAEAGVKTAAKPEIWAQPAKFKAAMDAFIGQAAKFQTIAATGNLALMRDGAKNLGATCKGCHDSFRVPGK